MSKDALRRDNTRVPWFVCPLRRANRQLASLRDSLAWYAGAAADGLNGSVLQSAAFKQNGESTVLIGVSAELHCMARLTDTGAVPTPDYRHAVETGYDWRRSTSDGDDL